MKRFATSVMVLVPGMAFGQVIDFETLPDGTTPQASDDDSPLTEPFVVNGIEVLFGGDTNGDRISDEPAFLERIGDNGDNAFINALLQDLGLPYIDHADPGFEDQLGQWLLRSNARPNEPAASLIIDYSEPVLSASGEIWDIEASVAAGPEAWRVNAIDGNGAVVAFRDSPVIAPGSTEGFDGEPWVFNISSPSGFSKIAIEFTGGSPIGRGFAFNNFSATSTLSGPTLLTHQPDSPVNDPAGVPQARLYWSEPVTITASDVSVLTADDTAQPVPFTVEGSGTQITTISFTGEPGGPDTGSPVPLALGAYEIIVRDTARASANNAPIDGDNDGAAGGEASVTVAHVCNADLAEPTGLLDLSDINAFVTGFVNGCE